MGVELPLCVVVTILECCVTFSGVKLSIRSFVLFINDFYSVDHNSLAKKNLWSYAKKFIEKKRAVVPTFDQNKCNEYFNSVFKAVNPSKAFRIPSWMPTYSAAPLTPFDLTPPSYNQITHNLFQVLSISSVIYYRGDCKSVG